MHANVLMALWLWRPMTRGPPSATPVDRVRIERAVREILLAVGEDPDREGLARRPPASPACTASCLPACTKTRAGICGSSSREVCDEVVLVRDISFNSMCEHHMLPFMGSAHVAYLPGDRVIGLSKLARVVEEVARRPQVQERMTEQIANLLVKSFTRRGSAW